MVSTRGPEQKFFWHSFCTHYNMHDSCKRLFKCVSRTQRSNARRHCQLGVGRRIPPLRINPQLLLHRANAPLPLLLPAVITSQSHRLIWITLWLYYQTPSMPWNFTKVSSLVFMFRTFPRPGLTPFEIINLFYIISTLWMLILLRDCQWVGLWAPFHPFPLTLYSLPVGVVPKQEPGTFRVIHDLSFLKGNRVNDLIPNNLTSVLMRTLSMCCT